MKSTHSQLINQKIQRKGSDGVWKIWAADGDGLALMNHTQKRNMTRRISWDSYKKNWNLV